MNEGRTIKGSEVPARKLHLFNSAIVAFAAEQRASSEVFSLAAIVMLASSASARASCDTSSRRQGLGRSLFLAQR
jgi:hypothetical protein